LNWAIANEPKRKTTNKTPEQIQHEKELEEMRERLKSHELS